MSKTLLLLILHLAVVLSAAAAAAQGLAAVGNILAAKEDTSERSSKERTSLVHRANLQASLTSRRAVDTERRGLVDASTREAVELVFPTGF